MFDVRLFKGLREPYKTAQLLGKAEKISGFWKRLILLLSYHLHTRKHRIHLWNRK